MDADHSTPLMLPDGKLDSPVSLGHFLEDVPYYALYDDVKCERPVEVFAKSTNGAAAATNGNGESSTISSLWNSMF